MKNKLLKFLLVFSMILTLIPSTVYASTTQYYVESIYVAAANKAATAKNSLTNAGYTVIDYDLNESAGGDYVYMGYKLTTNPNNAITIISAESPLL